MSWTALSVTSEGYLNAEALAITSDGHIVPVIDLGPEPRPPAVSLPLPELYGTTTGNIATFPTGLERTKKGWRIRVRVKYAGKVYDKSLDVDDIDPEVSVLSVSVSPEDHTPKVSVHYGGKTWTT
jgi:hypothetical protein